MANRTQLPKPGELPPAPQSHHEPASSFSVDKPQIAACSPFPEAHPTSLTAACPPALRVFPRQRGFCFGNSTQRASRKQEGLCQNLQGRAISIILGSSPPMGSATRSEWGAKSRANTGQAQGARTAQGSSECAPTARTPRKTNWDAEQPLQSSCAVGRWG